MRTKLFIYRTAIHKIGSSPISVRWGVVKFVYLLVGDMCCMTLYDAVCICDARMSMMRFDMKVSSFSHISFNAGVVKTWSCQWGQRMRCWYAGDGSKTKWNWTILGCTNGENGGHVCLSHKFSHEAKCGTATFTFYGNFHRVNDTLDISELTCVFLERSMCLGIGPNRGPQIAAYVRQPSRFREFVPYTICCHQSTIIIHNQKTARSPSVPCQFLPCWRWRHRAGEG